MTRRSFRGWQFVHKWSSIVCTAFLLMLCITGLPLIFHDEIDDLAGGQDPLALGDSDLPHKSLDEMMRIAFADRPGDVGLFMSFDEDRPVVNITTGPRPDAEGHEMTIRSFDLRSGEMVGAIEQDGVMDWLLQLHTDMFLGLPGMLFLGAMGLLFLLAIVSGVVLYAPFMRKLEFGTVRASRPKRIKWLDYHNLLGIVALGWVAVVGLTGIIHTLATPIVDQWREVELAELTAPYRGRAAPAPTQLASLHQAVRTSLAAAPGSRVQFVAFPGGGYSSRYHYAVFLQGDTPLTKQLLTPALVDARSGALSGLRPMPWYMKALQLSRPLHFGDYGGLPLKILWAILDLFTILILGSGIYLWLGKRRTEASGEPSRRGSPAFAQQVPAE